MNNKQMWFWGAVAVVFAFAIRGGLEQHTEIIEHLEQLTVVGDTLVVRSLVADTIVIHRVYTGPLNEGTPCGGLGSDPEDPTRELRECLDRYTTPVLVEGGFRLENFWFERAPGQTTPGSVSWPAWDTARARALFPNADPDTIQNWGWFNERWDILPDSLFLLEPSP